MNTMTDGSLGVTVGVDTHADVHVAAVLDGLGRVQGTNTFAATPQGYRRLLDWCGGFGPIGEAGIEGTGSWGASLTRFLTAQGVACVEVNHPNRQHRRRHGKSDVADAIGAARAVLSGEATGRPRGNDGNAESLRLIRVAHRSAVKARTQAINQLRSIVTTGPDELTDRFAGLNRSELVTSAARLRPATSTGPIQAAKTSMRSLARRIQALDEEITDLAASRDALVERTAPAELLAEPGIGPAVAADLLIAVGDNPHRMRSEAAFAALCGVSPVDASSGRQQHHRLNRGGDRQANKALWIIVINRLSSHTETRDYMTRTLASNPTKTKKQVIRSLKRTMARHIWKTLRDHPPTFERVLDNP